MSDNEDNVKLKKEIQDRIDAEIEEEKTVIRVGRLYQLVGTDGMIYIGSTIQSLEDRFRGHREVSHLPPEKQQRVTRHFSKLGWDKVKIVLIKEMTCTLKELRKAEGELIREHIKSPLCLNVKITGLGETHQERNKRIYEEEGSIKVTCECGDVVTQASIVDHLNSRNHKYKMAMKELPPSELEGNILVYCDCGMKINTSNIENHLQTASHLLKMRIKLLPPQPRLPLPPPCHNPNGNGHTVYCLCPCGAFISRQNFSTHVKTETHYEAMMALGLIPIPHVDIPVQDPDLPTGKKRCACGRIILMVRCTPHYETKEHIRRMRRIAHGKSPDVSEDDEDDEDDDQESQDENQAPQLQRVNMETDMVKCKCDRVLAPGSLSNHLKTKDHADRMERIAQGIPHPLTGAARSKEMIECPCGGKHTRARTTVHRHSEQHVAWETKQRQRQLIADLKAQIAAVEAGLGEEVEEEQYPAAAAAAAESPPFYSEAAEGEDEMMEVD